MFGFVIFMELSKFVSQDADLIVLMESWHCFSMLIGNVFSCGAMRRAIQCVRSVCRWRLNSVPALISDPLRWS